jgi:hypothetical protein
MGVSLPLQGSSATVGKQEDALSIFLMHSSLLS